MENEKRTKNYTEREKMTLLKIVQKYMDIIENKAADAITIRSKKDAWKIVAKEFNTYSECGLRNAIQLKNLYNNLKRQTRKDKTNYLLNTEISEVKKEAGEDEDINGSTSESNEFDVFGKQISTQLENHNNIKIAPKKTKNFDKFSRKEDEALLERVSWDPALYDINHKEYKDNSLHENIWLEIGETIERSSVDCKTRNLRAAQNSTCSSAGTSKPGEYMQQMSFLNRIPDSKRSSVSLPDFEETSCVESATEPCQAAKKRKTKDRILEIMKNSNETRSKLYQEIFAMSVEPQKHPVQLFFDSMAKTVITFPAALAAEAKLRICQIVTELECRSSAQASSSSQSHNSS